MGGRARAQSRIFIYVYIYKYTLALCAKSRFALDTRSGKTTVTIQTNLRNSFKNTTTRFPHRQSPKTGWHLSWRLPTFFKVVSFPERDYPSTVLRLSDAVPQQAVASRPLQLPQHVYDWRPSHAEQQFCVLCHLLCQIAATDKSTALVR